MKTMDIQEVQQLFPGVHRTIYLNTASLALGNTLARTAYERAVAFWLEGAFDWAEAERAGEAARKYFAAIVGAEADEIAIIPAVSTSAGVVASQLGTAQPGQNILVADKEFSSNYYAWLMLQSLGYEIRTINLINGVADAEAFAERVDGGTRLIAVSAVQSASGYRIDLSALSQIASHSGAWLFVDGSQAVGAVPLNVVRDGIDFLAVPSHKFLLGTRGMGYLYVRREILAEMRPILAGWKAARQPYQSFYGPGMDLSSTASKLDTSLAWFAALAEQESLSIFSRLGLESIWERNHQLSQYLQNRFLAKGLKWTPFKVENQSTIISVPVENPEDVMRKLREANVVVSMRAGNIRLSHHFYNSEEEIDKVCDLIS